MCCLLRIICCIISMFAMVLLTACAGPAVRGAEPLTRGNSELPKKEFFAHAGDLRLDPEDPLALRVVSEYGAVFVAQGGVEPPKEWLFPGEEAVAGFQGALPISASTILPSVELQSAALKALEAATHEAASHGLTISPNGVGSARRSYAETLKLWQSRLEPGLDYWVKKGKVTAAERERILALPIRDQIDAALELEKQKVWLSKQFDKPILQSVAAPGTSQHLSLLAIDIAEHANFTVRSILAKYGWYQTVYSDLPHFTYLGVSEDRLPSLGLVRRTNEGRAFWVVNMPRVRGEPEPDLMEKCAF